MSSTLSQGTVRHVAHLARLEVSDAEVALFAEQLSAVLSYVEQLAEVDTSDTPPTAHARPMSNVFREDRVRASLDPTEALHNAPRQKDSLFCVPRVLDQDNA